MGIQDRGLKLYPVEEHTQFYLTAEYRCGFIWKCREMAAQKMRVTYAFFSSPFLDILSMCFILFLFLRDADSRKGTLCPFYVPNRKKKGKKKFQIPQITKDESNSILYC